MGDIQAHIMCAVSSSAAMLSKRRNSYNAALRNHTSFELLSQLLRHKYVV